LGQGSYDYKGIQGSRSSYVPTWESAESEDLVASYSSDDYFIMFSNPYSFIPSLVLGRVNARSEAEADAYAQKVARYEDASGADAWKMRALYIADDAWNPDQPDPDIGDGTIHGDAMEALASETPDEIEKRKIYEAEYPTVWTASGRTKPGAYQDIIDQVNQGVLIVNFAGHGNQSQFTHENIFNVATSIPQLTNSDRLPFWFLATCNFSDYDDPEVVTGSEVLINKPDGGGIGVIAATREVYAGDNSALSQGTYGFLFATDAFVRLSVERPATALFRYKVSGGNDGLDDNDQKYFYMGDPTMYLQFPKGYATFDSANGIALDSAGISNATVARFRSLGRVTLSGTIRGTGNRIDTTYQGLVQVSLNDATRRDSIINYYPGYNWGYAATGGLVFRGDNTVRNGKFSATFIVPKDIEFSDSLSRGRLLAYVTPSAKTTSDAAAYTGNVHIGGVDTTSVHTSTGPKISIYLGSRSFRSGDLISQNATLLVDLADSVGINTSTSGIGHRIEMWLNGATQSKDLTDFYASTLDSYRSGSVQYPMTNLPQGKNTLRIRAWNSYDYSSTSDTYFQVTSSDQLTITNVFNYPNPFGGEGTEFTFQQNQTGPLNVTVKIFTIAGRLIRTLESFASGDSFVRLPWDGRDRDGDRIANGVYLYKLVVRTADGRFSSEVLGKMSKIQ
ncbi:MAG TPA: type IX secretion system sortase PorU, partial [Bacteroidota bacterium]|nr:type IX secretion system sortase PorU [Bacteroidota bacterium]